MPPLIAATFLTILPLRLRHAPTLRELGAAVGWYPAVGYGIGGALAVLDAGLRRTVLTPPVVAVLLVVTLAVMTGFLHLDGVIDTCDAVFAQRTPAERLAIARDPRAGAFGVVGAVLVLLLKTALLSGPLAGHRTAVIACVPALARCAMAGAVVLLPAARGTAGLGGGVKQHAGGRALVLAIAIALVPAALLLHWAAVALALGALFGGGAIALVAVRRLGGMTGDAYGAVCECAELGGFLAAALLA